VQSGVLVGRSVLSEPDVVELPVGRLELVVSVRLPELVLPGGVVKLVEPLEVVVLKV
jgi:hypothetical protein